MICIYAFQKHSDPELNETEEIPIDELENFFPSVDTDLDESEDENIFVNDDTDDDNKLEPTAKNLLVLAAQNRINDWKNKGVDIKMMDKFDNAYDIGNFFGYKINSNTTIQQNSIQQFSIYNETTASNNSTQTDTTTTTTKVTFTVKEFSYLSSSMSSNQTAALSSTSSSSSMLDSLISHPFFRQNSKHKHHVDNQNIPKLLSSSCQNKNFKKKLSSQMNNKLSSIKLLLPEKSSPDISNDLFIFKKPKAPVPKVKTDKISNDKADKRIVDHKRQCAADNDSQTVVEKLIKECTVHLKRLNIEEKIPLLDVEKINNERKKLTDNKSIKNQKKKEIINKENILTSNNVKMNNKMDLNTEKIKQHVDPVKSKEKIKNKIDLKTEKIKQNMDSVKSKSKSNDDMAQKSNNSKNTKLTDKLYRSIEKSKLKEISALISDNIVKTDLPKKDKVITNVKLTKEKPVKLLPATNCMKNPEKIKSTHEKPAKSLTDNCTKKSKKKYSGKYFEMKKKKPQINYQLNFTADKNSTDQVAPSSSSSSLPSSKLEKFKEKHLSTNSNKPKSSSSKASQLKSKEQINITDNKTKSTNNIPSIVPSTSIVNSTAIQSDRAMMENKKQFSENIKSDPLIVNNNNFSPIIIYCPLKSLQNKVVDENGKILLTKNEIESKIGKNYMELYFGKHEPKIRCNANNQLLFIPPRPITIDESYIDCLYMINRKKGKIIEKKMMK